MQSATLGPDISIAMATYNGSAFIDEQLKSLAAQTFLPMELVVTDDGSCDDTLEQLDRFAARAPFRVTIVRNEARLGWRGNFMKAASLCQGDLIAFCDQDDVWYPTKLQTMHRLFDNDHVLLAYHDADVVDQQGKLIGRLRATESDCHQLIPRARPTTWSHPAGLTQVFRKILAKFYCYWPLSADPRDPQSAAAHDQWYYYLAANLGHVRYTPQRLLAYRQHGKNTVGFRSPSTRSRILSADTSDRGAAGRNMLDGFCRVLETAEADGMGVRLPELPAAVEANRQLLNRLRLDHLAHHDRGVRTRFLHFVRLLNARAYSRRTTWNLGYRAMLNAAFVGVPFGR